MRLLSTSCSLHDSTSNDDIAQCISFDHFKRAWSTTSFSLVHLGHVMSTVTCSSHTARLNSLAAHRRGLDRHDRLLLQGMFDVILGRVRVDFAKPPDKVRDASTMSRQFVRMAYALFCLHGTQLLVPPEPIRVDPSVMRRLMEWEEAALDDMVLNSSSSTVVGVIAEL